MVNASKILTVSYGTFSCTLEGFDDPFSTMRSIAEYFRDLAADDRYFGAEPPTPDAEMLHRIAEREIQRRVEARVQDNGIVLRQMDEGVEAGPALNAPEPEPEAAPEPAPEAPKDTTVAPAPPVASPRPAEDAPEAGSVEAKLARIRAAMARDSAPFTAGGFAAGVYENGAPVESGFAPAADSVEEVAEKETPQSVAAEDAAIAPELTDEIEAPEPDVAEPAEEIAELDASASEEDVSEDVVAEVADGAEAAEDADTEDADTPEDVTAAAPDAESVEEEIEVETPEIEAASDDSVEDDAETVETPVDISVDETDAPEIEAVADERAEEEADSTDTPTDVSIDAAEEAETEAAAEVPIEDEVTEADAETAEDDAEAAELDDDALIAALTGDEDEAAAMPDGGEQAEAEPNAEELLVDEEFEPEAEDTDTPDDLDADSLIAMVADSADAEEFEAEASEFIEDVPEADGALSALAEDFLADAEKETSEAETDEDVVDEAEEPAEESPEAIKDTFAALVAETQKPRDEVEAVTEAEESALDLGVFEAEDETAAEASADISGALMLSDHQRVTDDGAGETAERPRVRVIKMSRAEFDQNFVAEDEVVDSPELGSEDEIRKTLGDTGLSAEDEADLISELAEVEREADVSEEAVEPAAEADAGVDAEPVMEEDEPVAEAEDDGAEVADDDSADIEIAAETKRPAEDLSVDRLLAQTDTELADTENSRRRSAIAHLKAAVAAVRADGSDREAKAKGAEETMDQFRDDLAQAVRTGPKAVEDAPAIVEPKHHAASDGAPRRPRPMPPLMLVSEQRIDKPSEDTGPIRPRRVQATDIDQEPGNMLLDGDSVDALDASGNVFSETDDFRGFVEETGAESLQELLEASAAFGTFVEDADNNSRPQIMARVQRYMPEGSFSREDGLRAFGVLLREGRIVRVERGRFAAPDKSPFKPEQRSAAG